MNAVKKVALHLYALPQNDKEWLLENLSVKQRTDVSFFLDELSLLGIPKDFSLISQVLDKKTTHKINTEFAEQISVLSKTDPILLFEALSVEPDVIIAEVLNVNDWRWQESFLSLFDTPRRLHIEQMLSRKTTVVSAKVIKIILNTLIDNISNIVPSTNNRNKEITTIDSMKKGEAGKTLFSFLRKK